MTSRTQKPDKIYQIKITLTDAEPAIWRRIVSECAVIRPQLNPDRLPTTNFGPSHILISPFPKRNPACATDQ